MKKNNPTPLKLQKASFLTVLSLIAFASTIFGMEPKNNNSWLNLVNNSLLYGSIVPESFLSQTVDFEDLPEEEQAETFLFLLNHYKASTLESAATAINSLEKINAELSTLINSPIFCLKMIKRLSKRFNCSNETVAQVLQTKEAKKRLLIQNLLKTLFTRPYFNGEEFDTLYNQHENYIDLNFTYKRFTDPQYDDKDTLLIMSVMYESPYKTVKIESLRKTKKININYQNTYGETALIACAYNCDNPGALQMLCKAPKILLDLQDNYGNTALMSTCLSTKNKHLQSGCIFVLLYAGANPKIANKEGKTPLSINKDVKRIQDAIQKRQNERAQKQTKEKRTTKKTRSNQK